MKNKINLLATAIILTLTATSMVAQTTSSNNSRENEFGVKGGFNISNMYTDNADDENVLYGFNVGVFATFPLSEVIAIQPELYYTTKGSELEYNNDFINGSSKLRLDYIQLPVMVKFNVMEHLKIHFGPYGAYLVGAKVKSENNQNVFEVDEDLDTDDF